jgi:hypothetical protein
MRKERKHVWVAFAFYLGCLAVWGCYAKWELPHADPAWMAAFCWNVFAHTLEFFTSGIGIISLALFGALFQVTRKPKSSTAPQG